jgi:type 1 glutamine amidotransferase
LHASRSQPVNGSIRSKAFAGTTGSRSCSGASQLTAQTQELFEIDQHKGDYEGRITVHPPSPIMRRLLKRITIASKLTAFAVLLAAQFSVFLGAQSKPQVHVLILGGGTSHDFVQNYEQIDARTLTAAGNSVRYVETFVDMRENLKWAGVLIQTSNQSPDPDQDARRAIMDFVAAGGGLIVAHAGVWYNWASWAEYNRALIGGGTHGHDELGEFAVKVVARRHPILDGVPDQFRIVDELYHEEIDPAGSPVEVLATATSPRSGKVFPSVWVVKQGQGKIVCLALGHDKLAHDNPAYMRILENATDWAAGK